MCAICSRLGTVGEQATGVGWRRGVVCPSKRPRQGWPLFNWLECPRISGQAACRPSLKGAVTPVWAILGNKKRVSI